MAIKLEADDDGFELLSGLPARPTYEFFKDKNGAKHLTGRRIDVPDSQLEEQIQFLREGDAFVWKRYDNISPFRIHWAIVDGDVHWYRF